MSEIKPELVERMVEVLRGYVAGSCAMAYGPNENRSVFAEAAAIVAELPVPVDSDLIEARRLAKEALTCPGQSATLLHNIVAGHCDAYSEVRIALAAIKRGRELATPEADQLGGVGV